MSRTSEEETRDRELEVLLEEEQQELGMWDENLERMSLQSGRTLCDRFDSEDNNETECENILYSPTLV